MRAAPALLIAVSLAGAGVQDAAAARLPSPHSWGKAGVSYLQYRTDAVECAWQASQTELKVGPSGLTLPGPQMNADGEEDVIDTLAAAANAYAQEKQMVQAKALEQLQTAVESCLRGRGYRPFRLTRDQAERLRGLRVGGVGRYEYLYSLAVDPAVLKAQGL